MIIKNSLKTRFSFKMKIVLRKCKDFLRKIYANYENFIISFFIIFYAFSIAGCIVLNYNAVAILLGLFLPTIILHFGWDE